MENVSPLQSILYSSARSRSMGLKLIVVCALALLMTIPALFVGGLVNDRSNRFTEANNHATSSQTVPGISSIKLADSYRSVHRSLKYSQLFVGMVFLSYFMFEVTSRKRVHPAQYILVGVAQIIFYLLLLSLAEIIGFDFAFLLAGAATVSLLSVNAEWIFKSRLQGLRALASFSLLYTLIYLLLRLEDYALLIGAVSSFAAVAGVMYLTRNIDWYSSHADAARFAQPAAAGAGREDSIRLND